MDRYRAFFDAALAAANAPIYGAGPPSGGGLPPPPPPSFQVPGQLPAALQPFLPSLLSGQGAFGGLFNAPGLNWGMFKNPNANTWISPLSLGQRGAAGGASAVAAAGPSPTARGAVSQATLPTPSGSAPVGTKATVLRWLPQAQAAAQKYNVPVEMVLAVINNESSGDPNAQSPWNPGQGTAKGLMQTLDLHYAPGENPLDPATNIDKGTKFLAAMYHRFGDDPDKAMAAYFGGPGAIDAQGNIRTGLSDVNISIGKYLSDRWRPALAAYRGFIQGQAAPGLREQPAPQAAQGAADLADLWAWLGGSRQPITGNFGAREGPYPGSGHRGMDIGAPTGTRLTSPIEGVVMAAGDVGGGYGNQVRIKTAYGSILLGHLASVAVQPGQRVTPGMVLGATGSTGKSTGPHLHFELRDQADNAIDPARYYRW
jgi:murein DD-endopeptidase MepM/ murein hydrolase activator NlpD